MSEAEKGGEAAVTKSKSGEPKMTPAEEAWDLAKTVFFAVAIARADRRIGNEPRRQRDLARP
jgi:hypothetical protein